MQTFTSWNPCTAIPHPQHPCQNKHGNSCQAASANTFPRKRIFEFWFKFHWTWLLWAQLSVKIVSRAQQLHRPNCYGQQEIGWGQQEFLCIAAPRFGQIINNLISFKFQLKSVLKHCQGLRPQAEHQLFKQGNIILIITLCIGQHDNSGSCWALHLGTNLA